MTDKEIRDFARSFTKGLLNGSSDDMRCFMVSAPLCGYLNAVGVQCDLVEGELNKSHHFWIKFTDNRIIDATAKQFGRGNIWLKQKPSEYHENAT